VGAVQIALGVVRRGCEIFGLATRPLQFTKTGSAALLLQQESNRQIFSGAEYI
jgi:hypothetical protein